MAPAVSAARSSRSRSNASEDAASPVRGIRPSAVERTRRQLSDAERELAELDQERMPVDDRDMASAQSGAREIIEALTLHTEGSPRLTAGDIDARWQEAYATGDEAPGGDNPTPDQDRVDDIGRALGVIYQDNEELEGAERIIERDRHRWELDPASSDDWPHDREK